MDLVQIKVDSKLKKAIWQKAQLYGVPASSLIRIVLVKTFLEGDGLSAGNVFNAERDNKGKSIKIDELINVL